MQKDSNENIAAIDVSFDNVSYTVPGTAGTLFRRTPTPAHQILHDVSGRVRAGDSLAILGPSGSGKTSLLNVLAARTTGAPTSGTILFDGMPRQPRTKRRLGYVMQDDVFFSKLTVREALQFTVDVRLSGVLTHAQRERRVSNVIRRLRLDKCADTRVGDQQFDKGISGGERKRLNIANELLHKPGLLLADECTSGLDSSSAYTVIKLLKELSNDFCTVVATIHQPSSQMFALFSNVLLLAEGRVVYFGQPQALVRHFEGLGFPFPGWGCNPAEFALQIVTRGHVDDAFASMGHSHAADCDADTAGDSDESSRTGDNAPLDENDEKAVQERYTQTIERITDAWREREQQQLCAPTVGKVGNDTAIDFTTDDGHCTRSSDDAGTSGEDNDEGTSDGHCSKQPSSSAESIRAPPTTQASRLARAATKRLADVTGKHGSDDEEHKYATPFWTQVRVLSRRSIHQKKGMLFEVSQIVQVSIVTLLVSLFWFRLAPREDTIEDRLGFLSFFTAYWAFNAAFAALFAFPAEKHVLNKDRAAGTYRLSAYFFAKSVVEFIFDGVFPLLSGICLYFTIGFNPDIRAFLTFLIVFMLHVFQAQGVGILISATFMDMRNAQVCTMAFILLSLITQGYLIAPENMPAFVQPLKYVSIIKYPYDALLRNELSFGRVFECAVDGASTTYSDNGASCPVGLDGLLKGAQLTNSLSVWGNVAVEISWTIVTRVLGYFALKMLHTSHKPKVSSWRQS